MQKTALCLFLACLSTPLLADPSQIPVVTVKNSGSGWRFNVTLRHPDTGWDHYADGWEILTPDGTRLGFRELLHPHVDEQPFTRSLTGVIVPDGVTEITIRARCSVDGWDETGITLRLPG
jgi:hypothetical protein